MDSIRDERLREEFRKASLEDSLVDFIKSVDKSEEFEGYGARFNAKCVESLTAALDRHSSSLQEHRSSVEEVRTTLASIKTFLMILTLCAVAMLALQYVTRPRDYGSGSHVTSGSGGSNLNSNTSGYQTDEIEDAAANADLEIPKDFEDYSGSATTAIKDSTPTNTTPERHTPANDPLLQGIENAGDINSRLRNISAKVQSSAESTGASQQSPQRSEPPLRQGSSPVSGESLFDGWQR